MKWIVRLIGVLVLMVVVAAVSILFLPAERIAKIAADQLRTVTGRDVSISGKVGLTFWPVLGVSADGLEVGNARWSEQGPMLSATQAAIGVDAMSLLRGEIRITKIEAVSPTIRLDQRKDGRASWQFSDASGQAQIATSTTPERAARPISIERLQITDATLIYDAEGADLVTYSGVDLTLDWPDRLGGADIQARVRPAKEPVDVSATIGGFAGFITGQVQPVDMLISTDAGSVRLNGRASTEGAVAGDLTIKTDDTARFLAALGVPGVALPQGLGRSIDARTQLTLTPDRRLALRDMTADLGGNKISGAADVSLNGVPQVNAQLDAGALDLTGGSASAGGGSAKGVDGWPKDRIDASGLAAFNGQIALRATSVNMGGFRLGATTAILRNEQSRMVFELRDVVAYGGNVTGEFVVNNRGNLSVGGKMAARGIELQPLLQDAADLSRLTGKGDADLSFLGSGSTVDAIMRSLSGQGALSLGRGTIEGLNLDRLMRSGSANGGTTIFESLNATFGIEGGVLKNRDLLLLLSSFRADGKGDVNLGAQTIDYLFTPVASLNGSGDSIAIPVRIVGPWASPSIKPDLQAAIDLNLDKEKKELEQKAKDEVAEKLGLTVQDGQSTEDAIKDKATDALKKELLKIFQ